MTHPLIQHLEYNVITDYGYQIKTGTAQKITEIKADTNNFLQKLVSITVYLSDKSETLSLEQYIIKVNRLQAGTSSAPSDITPSMVKIEALEPELAEIGRRRFNFPWRTGYSSKRYRKGLENSNT